MNDFGDTPGAMQCAGERCFCRQGLAVHPPVLMIFDPERGEYVAATGNRCAAVWASTGDGHLAGQICGRPAGHEVADIWTCDHHYKRMVKWLSDSEVRDHETGMRLMRERHAEQMRLNEEQNRQRIELRKIRIAAEEAARSEYSLVYYIQRVSDGIIKIGTSRGLAARLDVLRGDYGPLRLLALHGGTHIEEHAIHGEFRELLAEGREWFRPELPLLERVVSVRQQHETLPDPALSPLVGLPELRKMIRNLKRQRTTADAA